MDEADYVIGFFYNGVLDLQDRVILFIYLFEIC